MLPFASSRATRAWAPLLASAWLAACAGDKAPATAAANAEAGPNTDPVPAEALAAIDTATLMRHIRVLAHDSLLGRQPGTLGEERTAAYLEQEFRALGLAPGNPDGSYVQRVPLVGITVTNAPAMTFAKGGVTRTLRWRDDYVAWTKHVAPAAALTGAELVFVGYGTEAPEFRWDDYKGADLKGKVLVMLVNDPPLADTARFGGARMTYYGRWTYKYEQGKKHQAAGVLLVHETGPAGYPFSVVQGKTAEQFDLVAPDRNLTRAAVEGWITQEQAAALAAMAGQSLDSLKARAARDDFRPVPLGVTATVTLQNRLREVASRNLVARVAGRDSALAHEHVVYTAHWDHFGVGVPVDGDSVYNGAADNATGTAGLLAIAKAYAAMPVKPRRSALFLAVTAEEQGLLGAAYYAMQPLYPLADAVANLNMDVLSQWGPTTDLTVIGLGSSELDDYAAAVAREQGRVLRPDAEPEKGFYYRSDHFNFAKAGVPAFYAEAGVEVAGKPAGYGMTKRDEYTAKRYHAPQDEIQPDWELSGGVQDLHLLLTMGYRVGNAVHVPTWRPGNEFRAAREAMRRGAGR